MNHPGDILSALLDGELTAQQATEVQGHFEACDECRREYEAVAEVKAAVRALPVLDPPVPLIRPARWRGRAWAAASSVAAATLAIGLVITPAEQPPLDLDTMAGHHTARVQLDPGFSSLRGPVGGP